MSPRCILGWHRYRRVGPKEQTPTPWTTIAHNHECERCGAKINTGRQEV